MIFISSPNGTYSAGSVVTWLCHCTLRDRWDGPNGREYAKHVSVTVIAPDIGKAFEMLAKAYPNAIVDQIVRGPSGVFLAEGITTVEGKGDE